MIAICSQSAEAYSQQYLGKTVPILLETPYPDGTVDGHTDTYITVRVKTSSTSGSIINAIITGRKGELLYGEEAR